MTTVLSQKGQIVLPAAIRERMQLRPGDDFEVTVLDEDRIELRRIAPPPNAGFVDALLRCPSELIVPERDFDDTAPRCL